MKDRGSYGLNKERRTEAILGGFTILDFFVELNERIKTFCEC